MAVNFAKLPETAPADALTISSDLKGRGLATREYWGKTTGVVLGHQPHRAESRDNGSLRHAASAFAPPAPYWLLASHLMVASKKGIRALRLSRVFEITYKSACFTAGHTTGVSADPTSRARSMFG